jgi:hypothetical protein
MSKTFKRDLAASILVEALYTTDKETCEKYGVSIRSLQNYRQRLATDAQLALIFARRQKDSYSLWVDEVPIALFKAIRFIGHAADSVDSDPNYRKNPMVIEAVSGALKLVAEVHFANQVISARLNNNAGLTNADRAPDEFTQQIPASPATDFSN